jgi:chloramphenicol O-acetyltransferase type A
MSKFLDIDSWVRRQHFHFFKNYDNPYFNVCINVDVTNLLELTCNAKEISFAIAYHYLSTKAANEVDNFRYRIRGDHVIIHDKINTAMTIMLEDERFTFGYFEHDENFSRYHAQAKAKLAEIHAGDHLLKPDDRDDMIHYTVLPWFAFTSFSNARSWGIEDSIPKIAFGKYFEKENRIKMPVAVDVHHALMDGLHVGRYLERFENYLSDPRTALGL